jgi:parvulin-like peptidyl-prolyl isomerase
MKAIQWLGILALGITALQAADIDSPRPDAARNPTSAQPLFDDPILARGKGVLVKRSLVDEMYAAFRANRAAAGQTIPPGDRPRIEVDILDKLIATQLCLSRATPADQTKGRQIAGEFIAEQMKQVPSEESFKRQLLALGMTPEQFRAQITEQAVVKAVLDRELKDRKVVDDAEARKFYDDNPRLFEQSEMVRVSHILLSTSDPTAGRDLSAEEKLRKRELAEKLLARARKGEDFKALIKEFSEDKNAEARNGEYTITRNDRRYVLSPEFEGAAFSLAANQISDIIASPYGLHIIKSLEKIPARKTPYAKAEAKIKETLRQEAVQKELPGFIAGLRKEAGIEILKREDGR